MLFSEKNYKPCPMPVDKDDEVFLNFKRGLVSCDAFHFSRIDRNFNFVDPLENSAEVTYRVEYVVHKMLL